MYILDSNVIIHYLNSVLPQKSIEFINSFIDEQCLISVISQMELLGFNYKNKNDQKVIEFFIENSEILNINSEIVIKTIAIRKSKKIDLPDAIIAATAIFYNYTLITHNIKDFEKIKDLKILNSFEI